MNRMDPLLQHWIERWEAGETRWHLDEPNPVLVRFAEPSWRRVLVPLCGASRDLGWLADAGREVVGVEISNVAARRVFDERGEVPDVTEHGPYTLLRAGMLTVAIGDVFEIDPRVVGTFDGVYDRAALVAIQPERREEYVAALRSVAPSAVNLLSVFDYPREAMDGPPHSVGLDDVQRLYSDVEQLAEEDLSAEFADRGGPAEFLRRVYRTRL